MAKDKKKAPKKQTDFKEEFEYFLENVKYYLGTAKDFIDDKLAVLPKAARYAVVGVGALIIVVILKLLLFSGGDDNSANKTPQAQVVAMPQLEQVNKLDAEQKLGTLNVTNIQEQVVSGMDSGDPNDPDIIINQSPKQGTPIKTGDQGDKIVLQYGSKSLYEKSKINTTVPSEVKGMTVAKAIKYFKAKGFSNVTFPIRTDPTLKDDMLVVTGVTPDVGTQVTLNTPIKVSVEPGFDMDDLRTTLDANYIPYKNFADIEPLQKRDLKIVMAAKSTPITKQKDADALARVHKLGIEKALGEPIGSVTLVAPGGKITGNSDNVEIKQTSTGVNLTMAQQFCLKQSSGTYTNLNVNWDKDTLLQKIDESSITLMASATVQDQSNNTQQVIMTCTVKGDPDNLEASTFNLQ